VADFGQLGMAIVSRWSGVWHRGGEVGAMMRLSVGLRALPVLVTTAGLLLSGWFSGPAPAAPAAVAPPEVYAVPSKYDWKVLKWTNVARTNHDRKPLKMGACLDGYAERWTRHMAATDTFEHQDLGPILIGCHRHTVGENIAYGTGTLTARQVVRLWMHSPGHRANILDRDFTAIGIAAWRSADTGRTYVTQDFGG